MTTPQEFLEEFTKDLIANPGDRPTLIAGWAKHLEAREETIRGDALKVYGPSVPKEYMANS